MVAQDEGEEDEEVGVGDFDAALGGRKNEDQVPEEDSGQDEEAQQVRPDVDRLVVKQPEILIENIFSNLLEVYK